MERLHAAKANVVCKHVPVVAIVSVVNVKDRKLRIVNRVAESRRMTSTDMDTATTTTHQVYMDIPITLDNLFVARMVTFLVMLYVRVCVVFSTAPLSNGRRPRSRDLQTSLMLKTYIRLCNTHLFFILFISKISSNPSSLQRRAQEHL